MWSSTAARSASKSGAARTAGQVPQLQLKLGAFTQAMILRLPHQPHLPCLVVEDSWRKSGSRRMIAGVGRVGRARLFDDLVGALASEDTSAIISMNLACCDSTVSYHRPSWVTARRPCSERCRAADSCHPAADSAASESRTADRIRPLPHNDPQPILHGWAGVGDRVIPRGTTLCALKPCGGRILARAHEFLLAKIDPRRVDDTRTMLPRFCEWTGLSAAKREPQTGRRRRCAAMSLFRNRTLSEVSQ